MNIEELKYANGLSTLIKEKTISSFEGNDKEVFDHFFEVIKGLFPNVFNICSVNRFDNGFYLVWKGRNDDKPIMFMHHHDVVEVSDNWKTDPFDPVIIDGKLYGRGTLDTKSGLYCMLQACEELIIDGFVPNQDIYFLSTSTEETSSLGVDYIAKYFKENNISFEYILDEGGMICFDPVGFAKANFAMVGVGEKATVSIKVSAKGNGGHASTPGDNTPLVRLSKFVLDVEKSKKFKKKFNATTKETFKRFGKHSKGALKVLLTHPNLFGGLITLAAPSISPTAKAMFRTTIAFTCSSGSLQHNVLPDEASITANIRFSHHQGVKNTMEVLEAYAKKYDLRIEYIDKPVESKISDFNNKNFKIIEDAITNTFTDVITNPFIGNTASDSRYLSELSDNIYRFAPFEISEEQLESIHADNENIDICALPKAVEFFKYLYRR